MHSFNKQSLHKVRYVVEILKVFIYLLELRDGKCSEAKRYNLCLIFSCMTKEKGWEVCLHLCFLREDGSQNAE